MPLYRSVTGNSYTHPFQENKVIAGEPVLLEADSWLQAQLDAGLIIEIGGDDKPAKGKKEAAAE